LLDKAIRVPEPTQEECLSHYQRFPQHFRKGQIAEVSHILYQVTPQVDLEALRAHALAQLAVLQADPSQFAAIAKAQSNCPSGQQGGNLGQVTPGQMVPEFDAAVWKAEAGTLIPAWWNHASVTSLRWEIRTMVCWYRLNSLASSIATALQQRSFEQALQEYLRQLVQQADIRGADFLPQFQTQSSGVAYAN
jgi:peptidyl-prolyl cis-trans isomerase C